jgi:cytoskeletal protein CcmA (bactofilin family)
MRKGVALPIFRRAKHRVKNETQWQRMSQLNANEEIRSQSIGRPAGMVALVLHENRPDDRDIGLASHGHTGGNGEVDMLNSFKSKAAEQDKSVAASAADVIEQAERSVVEQVAPKPERTTKTGPDSCIGSGMSVVGKIECNGPAQVFGRIEGELRASDLLIGDGAQIEGSVIAQNVTVCGRVKGTIHAVRVTLQNGGAVEGDIFHEVAVDRRELAV